MTKRTLTGCLLALLLLAACGGTTVTSPTVDTTNPGDVGEQLADDSGCPTEGKELETARLYIEHNATDADTGIHGFFGGDGWSQLCIWGPDGDLLLEVAPAGPLGALGLADLFFESREPPNDAYSITDLRAAFPEGEYRVGGTDFEGVPRVAEAVLTHDIPAEPSITAPELVDDEEDDSAAWVARSGLTVAWEPVTASIDGDPVVIVAYEVIITKVEHDDPHGWSRPIYDVHVPPDRVEFRVPDGFLEPETRYELEVLAIEGSGNQTIGLGFFTTGQ